MKRKLYLALCAVSISHILPAQSGFYVGNDAALDIKANTAFHISGLVLQPGNDYRISNTEMLSNNTVAHYTVQNYVSGATTFSNNIPPFTGIMGYYYADTDLNGIDESVLGIKIHNGNYWQTLPTGSRNNLTNIVLSDAVSNLVIREIVLADQFVTLPLVWGPVQAIRYNNDVRVSWSTRSEQAVAHFQVERSLDGRQWLPEGDAVEARNLAGEQSYQATDDNAPSQRLYYRIRQQDFDGRYTYSAVVAVAAIGESLSVNVFPNPTVSNFRVTGIDPLSIHKVEVFDTRGALLLNWTKARAEYDIRALANGVYHIRVHLRNGETQNKQLIKK